MIASVLIFAVLLFAVGSDFWQSPLAHAIFRAAACCLAVVCLVMAMRRQRLQLNWLALVLALPAIWGLTQLALHQTTWNYSTWQSTLQWCAYWALYVAALQITALRSQLQVAAWFAGVFSAVAIAEYLTWSRLGEPMMATFFNQNHYAAFMELLFPIVLWRLIRDKAKPLYALCALAVLTSVAISGSRAGIVLLLVELLYLGLRTSRKPLYVAGGALAVAVLAIGFMWTRFQTLNTSEPYESRNATARASIQMIHDKPTFGFGLGTWPTIYPAYAERDTGFRLIHADDDWLEWTAEGGIPFAVIMLGIVGFAIFAAWKEPWCAGCVTVLLHSLVEFPMQKQALWAWFVVLLAVAQTHRNARRKQAS